MNHPTETTTLALVAGARPNFMKVAPLMQAFLSDPAIRPVLIHTGQHYDENMSGRFFRELGIPVPDHHLEVGPGSHAVQTAEIMKRLEPVFLSEKPAAVVVVGDVNSTVAAALVASKLGIAIVHAEAGLRSFDRTMPEEINRMVTDSISDLLLITEESGRRNLLREGHPEERIVLIGNLMIDSLRRNLDEAMRSDVKERLHLNGNKFGLVTLHRPANVDEPAQLAEILSALTEIATDVPLLWPMHPRTKARLQSSGTPIPETITAIDPLGYFDFLCLQASASVILTDSGGVQEESTVLGVPCLTLRNNTERPVTIDCGTNILAGTSRESILAAWLQARHQPKTGATPPLWDGQAGVRSLAAIKEFLARR
jgi:UDP-N-acetylglucosamine 2-epimerase (non-hydrolysing)